jgi:hypothetical protein
MKLATMLGSLAALAAITLFNVGSARADAFGSRGYVCNARYHFDGSDYYGFKGNFGYVSMTVSAEPNCMGAQEYNMVCSTGATNPACKSPVAQRSEATLLAIFQAMMNAKESQLKVWMHHAGFNDTSVGPQYTVDMLGYDK